MKRLLLVVLLYLLAAAGVRGDDFSKQVNALEKAWMRDDGAEIRASVDALQKLPPGTRVTYAIGYAERRLAFLRTVPQPDRMAAMADAIARFEEVIKAEPANAEGHALLASSLGSMIGFDRKLAMDYGPRSGQEMEQALSLEPNNPRVLVLAGISAFMKPEEYGGGMEKAEPLLRRAASILAQQPDDRPWPNWGRFDAHMWLGQLLDKSGKHDDARTEYEAALAIAPQSQWARAILRTQAK
jgi:tetratricopeptide (TPR) repeat protein